MTKHNNNQKKEITAIYIISVLMAGWTYIGLRNAYLVENSIKTYFIFVLCGIVIAIIITAPNICYRKYKESEEKGK